MQIAQHYAPCTTPPRKRVSGIIKQTWESELFNTLGQLRESKQIQQATGEGRYENEAGETRIITSQEVRNKTRNTDVGIDFKSAPNTNSSQTRRRRRDGRARIGRAQWKKVTGDETPTLSQTTTSTQDWHPHHDANPWTKQCYHDLAAMARTCENPGRFLRTWAGTQQPRETTLT